MKIALFSDVHANLPALQACLRSIEQQEADVIFCLGDLVGYNVWPNEVIDEIRRRGIPVLAGNYDVGIGLNSDECGCAYKTDVEKEMGKQSISLTNAWVQPAQRNYLRQLPAHIRLEYKLGERKYHVLLVHGSPRKVNEYLFEDRDEKSLVRIMQDAGADVLCFGHTHKPFHRVLHVNTDGEKAERHAINIGSVGKPKDGDHRGCYALIELHSEQDFGAQPNVSVSFIRFEYDVELAAKAIEKSELPNAYADMLRKAY